MQLNVYVISHPIIQQFSSDINTSQMPLFIKKQRIRQLGLLLIYETMRKRISIKTLYVQKIDMIKEIHLVNPNESYIIITNMAYNHDLTCDLTTLLPNSSLNPTYAYLDQEDWVINPKSSLALSRISKHKKIIITEQYLQTNYIVQLLSYLVLQKSVKLSQIIISCIACQTTTLEILGAKYPNLSIYTTKIFDDPKLYNQHFLHMLDMQIE